MIEAPCRTVNINSGCHSGNRAAKGHADDIAWRDFVSSITPEAEGPGPQVDCAGLRWRNVSDSTAVDRATAELVVEGWMKIGDKHRQNTLDPDLRHLGIGIAKSKGCGSFSTKQISRSEKWLIGAADQAPLGPPLEVISPDELALVNHMPIDGL